eukprot:COSAG01_NODE_77377_length_165_cov_125.287879_1_plen_54_part_11
MWRLTAPSGPLPTDPHLMARRFHPQFRDQNRRGIGKSQSAWTDSKMEVVCSHRG